jgi:hypothetical protein
MDDQVEVLEKKKPQVLVEGGSPPSAEQTGSRCVVNEEEGTLIAWQKTTRWKNPTGVCEASEGSNYSITGSEVA